MTAVCEKCPLQNVRGYKRLLWSQSTVVCVLHIIIFIILL